jgi:hypothetical protein
MDLGTVSDLNRALDTGKILMSLLGQPLTDEARLGLLQSVKENQNRLQRLLVRFGGERSGIEDVHSEEE